MIFAVTNLDLLSFQSQIKLKSELGRTFIYDPLRRKFIALTPEEMVRQLLIQALLANNYPRQRMVSERAFQLNGLIKRFDLLVLTRDLRPWMLAECKSADYPLTQSVFDQALGYNYHYQVPYVLVTNGRDTYCLSVDTGASSFNSMTQIPDYPRDNTW